MPRTRTLLALVTILAVSLTGCTKHQAKTADLPAGDQLMRQAATAMREVNTAHIVLTAEGTVADLPIRRADGDLTRAGEAKGTIQMKQLGVLVEFEFVVTGDKIYLKGPTGSWQALPAALAASVYDPSAILDPDRGVATVLTTATNPKTEAREEVDGHQTYRVAAAFATDAVKALVPGVGDGLTGQVWLDTETTQVRRVKITIPSTSGDAGTVDIVVSNINSPVTISAP